MFLLESAQDLTSAAGILNASHSETKELHFVAPKRWTDSSLPAASSQEVASKGHCGAAVIGSPPAC